MSLSTGARLGPYEIDVLIGAGGMGEVYREVDLERPRAGVLLGRFRDIGRRADVDDVQRGKSDETVRHALFSGNAERTYDVTRDGQKFLMIKGRRGRSRHRLRPVRRLRSTWSSS